MAHGVHNEPNLVSCHIAQLPSAKSLMHLINSSSDCFVYSTTWAPVADSCCHCVCFTAVFLFCHQVVSLQRFVHAFGVRALCVYCRRVNFTSERVLLNLIFTVSLLSSFCWSCKAFQSEMKPKKPSKVIQEKSSKTYLLIEISLFETVNLRLQIAFW